MPIEKFRDIDVSYVSYVSSCKCEMESASTKKRHKHSIIQNDWKILKWKHSREKKNNSYTYTHENHLLD